MPHASDSGQLQRTTPEDGRDWERMAERVKRDHAMMRGLLDDVERACRALDELRPESLVRFREATRMLYVAFDDHLATEEGDFAPILRTVDAWGEVRVDNMVSEHNDQRRLILELVERADSTTGNVEALVAQARGFVAAFRLDMDSEESSMDEQGRAPPVVPDQEDG